MDIVPDNIIKSLWNVEPTLSAQLTIALGFALLWAFVFTAMTPPLLTYFKTKDYYPQILLLQRRMLKNFGVTDATDDEVGFLYVTKYLLKIVICKKTFFLKLIVFGYLFTQK